MLDNYCSSLSEKWCTICLKNLFISIKTSSGHCLYNKILTQQVFKAPDNQKCSYLSTFTSCLFFSPHPTIQPHVHFFNLLCTFILSHLHSHTFVTSADNSQQTSTHSSKTRFKKVCIYKVFSDSISPKAKIYYAFL